MGGLDSRQGPCLLEPQLAAADEMQDRLGGLDQLGRLDSSGCLFDLEVPAAAAGAGGGGEEGGCLGGLDSTGAYCQLDLQTADAAAVPAANEEQERQRDLNSVGASFLLGLQVAAAAAAAPAAFEVGSSERTQLQQVRSVMGLWRRMGLLPGNADAAAAIENGN